MNRVTDTAAFVRWFRNSSPYIDAHRGRTFVIYVGGEAVSESSFANIVHDLTLLTRLGVKLVVVYGIKPQLRSRLNADARAPETGSMRTPVDEAALGHWREAAGAVRFAIESQLTVGLANSPMDGARMRVMSGNFVLARPLGVRDGLDFCFAGEVRRVDIQGIRAALDANALVLIGPLGYSPTGELFALGAEEVAIGVATGLTADKLLYLAEEPPPATPEGTTIKQLNATEAEQLLAERSDFGPMTRQHLQHAIRACAAGVRRVHLLQRKVDGALLQELFTRDGVGTLVSGDHYEQIRPATIEDVAGVLELIAPLEDQGILVRRSRELLENEIGRFVVTERDGGILACAALYPFSQECCAELACLATHPEYRGEGRAEALLTYLETRAIEQGISHLFVLTTHTAHWFQERGFEPADVADLPFERQKAYNYQRNSHVFTKTLT